MKKLIAFFLAVLFVFGSFGSIFAGTVTEHEKPMKADKTEPSREVVSGTCGENLTWTLDAETSVYVDNAIATNIETKSIVAAPGKVVITEFEGFILTDTLEVGGRYIIASGNYAAKNTNYSTGRDHYISVQAITVNSDDTITLDSGVDPETVLWDIESGSASTGWVFKNNAVGKYFTLSSDEYLCVGSSPLAWLYQNNDLNNQVDSEGYYYVKLGSSSNYFTTSKNTDGTIKLYKYVTSEPEGFIYYTVTFKDWDGTVLSTQTVEEGYAATAPAVPVRTGYTFTGWDTDFSNVTSDLIVTAQYQTNAEYISDNPDCGIVKIQVKDSSTLMPIPNACVSVSTIEEGESTFYSDSNGEFSFVSPIGRHTMSFYAPGYLVRTVSINVENKVNEYPSLGLSTSQLVGGELTVTELTYDQIVEAGIDITDPDNQHIFLYEATISFNAGIDWESIAYYINSNGVVVGMPGSGSGVLYYSELQGYYHNSGGSMQEDQGCVVFPVAENFFLVFHGEVKWVKEMFDVELLVVNFSNTDTIEDCTAELTLPEGLSLADMNNGEQELAQFIDRIEEGGSTSVHWYIRGDEPGFYDISARLGGKMMPFEDEFEYNFVAKDPIKVYAENALHMTFELPDSAFHGEDYTVRIIVENVSDKPIFGISQEVLEVSQTQITYYSNGTQQTSHVETNEGEKVYVRSFDPGDKLVIEMSSNIIFDSQLMKYKIQQMENLIIGMLKISDFVNTVDKMLNTTLKYTLKIARIFDYLIADLELPTGLNQNYSYVLARDIRNGLSEIQAFMDRSDGNKIYVSGLFGEHLAAMGTFADALDNAAGDVGLILDLLETVDLGALRDLVVSVAELIRGKDDIPEFNKYDAVRTAMSLIPIRYYLNEVVVSSLEGSTVQIPYSVSVTEVGPRYFGIHNINKYIMNLVIACFGKMEVPGSLLLFGVSDDITGYESAVEYVTAVNNEALALAAKDATGETVFSSWIETNSDKKDAPVSYSLCVEDNDSFEYNDGVLTFTGNGIIKFTPNECFIGILHVKMINGDDECEKEYHFNTIEPHTCNSDQREIVIPAAEENPAYVSHCCSICGEIMELEEVEMCSAHSFGEWIEELSATDTHGGIRRRTCSVCGFSEMVYLDPLCEIYSGTCGDDLTWTLNASTGLLEIIGMGEMTNWSSVSSVPWYSYRSSITTVIIGNGVTSIGDYTFRSCNSLTSLTIPDSVTSIGDDAFSGCALLISAIIPNSVTSIGDSAFSYCASLTSVTIGSKVSHIGDWVFYKCTSLTAIIVDENNQQYSSIDGVLFNKSATVLIQYPQGKAGNYTIPNSVTSIGDDAFYICSTLISVIIPSSVTTIGEYAFYKCTSLTSVTIGDGVTSIGDRAFFNCTSLTSVTIPDSVTSIGNYAFYECNSLTSVTIGNSVTRIGDSAFYSCSSLTSVTIPDSVTSIGDTAFYGCSSLTSVTIPDSVTSIGYHAFYKCTSLTSASIGNGVTSIAIATFESCSSLTSITVDENNQVYSSIDGVLFNKTGTELVLCPEGKTGDYSIPNSVTSIGDYAFHGCSSLTSVSIPRSMTSIGDSAFNGCSSLASVTIPDSVTRIGDYAFYNCSSLTSAVFLGEPPSTFGSVAFDYSAPDFCIYYYPEYASSWSPNGQTEYYGYPICMISGPDIEPGDIDGDGLVTMADVTLLSMYLNGENPQITEPGMANADANEDGTVDIRDIAAIYAIIAAS